MSWQNDLAEIFGYVGQETFEYASEMLADVSEDDVSIHERWHRAFDIALQQIDLNNIEVLEAVNRFTVHASDFPSARVVVEEFRSLYLDEYLSR